MRSSRSASLVAVALLCNVAAGQTWPADFVTEEIGSGWTQPTCLCFAAEDSSADLLVTEKRGIVWNVRNGIRQIDPVIDLQDEILNNGDRGLLSVIADPEWSVNGWIYLLYIVDPNGDGADAEQSSFGRLTRYTALRNVQGDIIADPASRVVLIGATWPEGIPSLHLSHSTGNMRFGLDGTLFLSTGDGAHYDLVDVGGYDPGGFGSGKFPPSEDIGSYRSQSTTSLAGKILRIDPATGLGLADNPWYTGNPADNQSRVYAMGLRNPFRFTVRPNTPLPGRLYIADVGWDNFEEIDHVTGPGINFGWPCWEGPAVQGAYDAADPFGYCANSTSFTTPLWTYHHWNSGYSGYTGQCVTGMQVYAGGNYPSKYDGRLFFCEYASDWIRTVRFVNGLPTEVEVFGNNIGNPVELIGDPVNGDLLYIAIGDNAVRRIRYTKANHPPEVTVTTSQRWGPSPLAVTFDASASVDPEGQPLSFLWDLGDGTTDTNAIVTHVYPNNVNYLVTLTVTDVGGETETWTGTIFVGNTPPVIRSINSPADGSFYTAGQVITFDATADDAEDTPAGIPLDAAWKIDLIHDHHVHPAWARVPGLSAQWTADQHSPGTYFHVTLRVTDSRGQTSTSAFDIFDQDAKPEPHLVSVSDTSPRFGTPITATAHLHYPGKGTATLNFQWGDGSADRFHALHFEDQQPTHDYAGPGIYTLRVNATDGVDRETRTQTIFVRPRQPAVAIFTPMITPHWIKLADQWQIASEVADAVRAAGYEAEIFGPYDQPALASWLDDYAADGVRDYLVCLDAGASVVYAGEADGSRAEQWLDQGNGVLWTGFTPFARYILPDGTDTNVNASRWALDDVLDPAVPRLTGGVGAMQLGPDAPDLPALIPFTSSGALITGRLNATWSIDKLYVTDGSSPPISDGLVIRDVNGGEYAQFFTANATGLPRSAVVRDFLLTHLFSGLPKGPGHFKLVDPPDHSTGLPTAGIGFKWRARPGTTSWLFELALDADFTAPVQVEVVTSPQVVLSKTLAAPQQYYWRVTGRNDYGFWTSETFDFWTGMPAKTAR